MRRSALCARERGAVLVAVTVVAGIAILLSGAIMAFSLVNIQSEREQESNVVLQYVSNAALNAAFQEIASLVDYDSDGLGALGVATPRVYTDSSGDPVAEWRTVILSENGFNLVLAVAALPSFDDPQIVRSAQGVVNANVEFLLKPKPAAMSISGPLTDPKWLYMDGPNDFFDGGEKAALIVSTEGGYDPLTDFFGGKIGSGSFDGSELQGDQTSVFEHDQYGEMELPILMNPESFLSAAELNDYRNSLREKVLTLAEDYDYEYTSSITGNHTWGSEDDPKVVVIDAKAIGKNYVFNTKNQTITGHGTMIIKHTVRPKKNLNLNWTGDIYVLGYDGDGSDLLYLFGTQGEINGNLILLSSDNTEASLELANSSRSYVGRRDRRRSDLTVNGALLCLAEASSHESEVEVEGSSRLEVNGMMGLYGSRIEIEASGRDTVLTVNGTLAVGMAQDLDEDLYRDDDFEFEMRGTVQMTYDEELVQAAIDGLAGLEADLGDSEGDVPEYNNFWFSGMSFLGSGGFSDLDSLNEALVSGQDLGVDMEQFEESAAQQ